MHKQGRNTCTNTAAAACKGHHTATQSVQQDMYATVKGDQ